MIICPSPTVQLTAVTAVMNFSHYNKFSTRVHRTISKWQSEEFRGRKRRAFIRACKQALINGTQLMTSIGAEAVTRARNVALAADVACALAVETLRGTPRSFEQCIHATRPHHGQQAVAKRYDAIVIGFFADLSRVQRGYFERVFNHCTNGQRYCCMDRFSLRSAYLLTD